MRDSIDAFKGDRVAVIAIGRVNKELRMYALALTALIKAKKYLVIKVNPKFGTVCAEVGYLTDPEGILETIQHNARMVADVINNTRPPPPIPSSRCRYCPYTLLCKKLRWD